jgi:hypothetical protein
MPHITRLSPSKVREKSRSGKALLICAYPDEEKFRSMQLEGAISLEEFQSRISSLPKDQEIIFY